MVKVISDQNNLPCVIQTMPELVCIQNFIYKQKQFNKHDDYETLHLDADTVFAAAS